MVRKSAMTPVIALRPETALLLCCARTCVNAEDAERIRTLLKEELDWDYLIRTALRHGVLPLLYWSLNTTCPEAAPKSALDQLRDYFHANHFHNLVMTKELLKLLNLFQTQGIAAIPFKGPVLAASAYGNLSLRQFSDLDILVHKRDVLRAKDLLISHRYRPYIELTSMQEAAHLRSRRKNDFQFVREDPLVLIELHWNIARPFLLPLDPEWLWKRLERVSLAGTTVLNFSPEDLLLILCVHGSKHHWPRLEWICDVSELIRVHQRMDWGRVLEQAGRLGSKRMLFLGLQLTRDLLGTALPEDIVQRMQADPVPKSLAAQIRQRSFSDVPSSLNGIEAHVFNCRMRERLRDRVRYLFYQGMTLNEEDRAFLPLPTFLAFLYYLIRPIRLVSNYGLDSVKHLLKHPSRF